jgi:hypothetical protein
VAGVEHPVTLRAMASVSDFDPTAFAAAFQRFLGDMERVVPPERNVLLDKVSAHLGTDPTGLPALTERYDPSEHPTSSWRSTSWPPTAGGS